MIKASPSTTEYYSYQRKEMLEFIPSKIKRVLDIGCSEGEFGLLLKQIFNAEVWGIEIYETAALIARNKLDKVIQGGFLENLNSLPENYFDCVIFNDALEHFQDPWTILEKVKKILNENGSVVASIPNVRYIGNLYELLIKKDWEYKQEGGILDLTHYRFFTYKSIIRLFEQSNFKINIIQGINPARSWKVKLFATLSGRIFSDSRFLQFAVVASPVK